MLAMVGVLTGYLELVLPRQKPLQGLHIVITPELQECDCYLVENVAVCGDRDGRWVLGNGPSTFCIITSSEYWFSIRPE
jgi:hypothetical protein